MAAVVFGLVAILVFGPYLRFMPEGVHVWPQADRLSLALNFYDGGFHFWHPRTSSFSPIGFTSIGGVTGVEFPIQPYLAALGGLLLGRDYILPIFRLLDASIAVLGFWYLFRIVYERTGSWAAGMLPGALLLASPTFIAYAGSTLPDPFSLSLTFVGYYYWLRYFEPNGRFADLPRGFAILSLAALIKTTCALHLGATAGIVFLYGYFEPGRFTTRQWLVLLATLAAGVGSIAVFYLHNQSLNEQYRATQFLATVMPVLPSVTWHETVIHFFDTWRYEYLSHVDYLVLGASSLVCLALLRRGWQQFRPLLLLLLLMLAIAYLFYQLMGPQIPIHDYYVICSYLPPVVLAVVLAQLLLHKVLPVRSWTRPALTIGLLVVSGYLMYTSPGKMAGRMGDVHLPGSRYYTHFWMRNGAKYLKQAWVPAKARVLILGDGSPNSSLVYFDRRGMTWLNWVPDMKIDDLERHMSADSLQYVIMPREAYDQLAPRRTELFEAFQPVLEEPVAVLKRRHPERKAW